MPRRRLVARGCLAGAALALLAGCAGSEAVRAAAAGHFTEASRAATAALGRGKLDREEARALARAVLESEVRAAEGAAGAARLGGMTGCAQRLDRALAGRASRADEAGAAAAMLRLGTGRVAVEALAPWALRSGAPAAWRAVGARALVGWPEGARRRALMVDPDAGVRLAALRAAGEAADPADTEPLLEAARLDPEPHHRVEAARAVAVVGGERVVLGLADLWPTADEPLRLAIVGAWSTAASLPAGGLRELSRTASEQQGAPAIAAAAALVRVAPGGADDAVGVLARAVAAGPTRERVYALEVAGTAFGRLREAVVAAEADTDDRVAVAALGAHLRGLGKAPSPASAVERASLVERLLALASSSGPRAPAARAALARVEVREVLPLVEVALRSPEAAVRRDAALDLLALGALPAAAAVAADPDPAVRVPVSCAILGAEPSGQE